MASPVNIVLRGAIIIAVANFAVFLLVSSFLGGDAINGYESDGHYFLKSHATVTEVSQSVFNYSKWHVRSLFLTHPLAMICAGILYRRRQR